MARPIKEILMEEMDKGSSLVACDTGPCRICSEEKDRRFGVCFHCADYAVYEDGYVWDVRDPSKKWRVFSKFIGNIDRN